jgi:hypothetical protein
MNFTPLNLKKFSNADQNLNTILLIIATLTLLVLAVVLFFLIQKKINP